MNQSKVLIIGSGHLAYRVQKQLDSKGLEAVYLPKSAFELKDANSSRLELIAHVLKPIELTSLSMVYVLDDNDAFNLELIIFLISEDNKIPITASLYNENIAPHLRAAHENINILNPAKIAAPKFVGSLDTPVTRFLNYKLPERNVEKIRNTSDNFIFRLVLSFIALIVLAVTYFHFSENISWVDSLYFIIVTIATVGYGDINLLNSSDLSKLVDVFVILSSTLFIWLIFSLTVDRIIKKRTQLSLGRKKYTCKNHVILCGLGRLGYFIAEELTLRGEKIIIIEKDENSSHLNYFRTHNTDIYIGDARVPQVLQDVGVMHAKAVISVINNDYTNLEIGLNARSFDQNLRLILRIFDESMSEKIKENLDIHLTHSTSAIADEHFVQILKNA